MIDLAVITATVARDRVAEQFRRPPSTDAADAAATAPMRRVVVRRLRAVADRLEPAIA